MDNFKINISNEYSLPGNGILEGFVHSKTHEMGKFTNDLPCLIVCPGGGYHFVSEREGEPIAIDFYNRNFNTFVLTYDVAPNAVYPLALTQLACSIDHIRKNAEKYRINPDKVYVVGFSAGGHLVGCLANLHTELPCDYVDASKLDASPNGVILSYPVIYPYSHSGSYKNLLGEDFESDPRLEPLTLHKSVNKKNPPCFIWTTAEDTCVNPLATAYYTTALLENGIKCESHVFPYGPHGGATCDRRTGQEGGPLAKAKCWLDLAAEFVLGL